MSSPKILAAEHHPNDLYTPMKSSKLSPSGPHLIGLAIWLTLASLLVAGAAPALETSFGESGLASLRYQGTEFIVPAAPYVEYYMPRTAEGTRSASAGEPTHSFDPATKTHTTTYAWGEIKCRFVPGRDRLDFDVAVTNRGPNPIFHLSINLLDVKLPAMPEGAQWKESHVISEGTDSIPALVADYGRGAMLFAGESFDQDYAAGFYRIAGQAPGTYGLNLSTIEKRAPDTIHQELSYRAGETKHYRLTLRFGPHGSTLRQLAGDLYPKYAKAHPRVLRWRDRRPIGAIVLSSSAAQHHSEKNPRGWLNDPALDAKNPKAFRKRLLGWANESVKVLKSVDAQGMIFWDLEGEELPHPTTFIGDPRLTGKFAPEMDAIADELFATFRKAGLRTGVCIRPSRIRPNPDKASPIPVYHDHMDFDPVAEMSAKVAYAKKRWGCMLFYIDTNVTWAFSSGEGSERQTVSWPMRAELLRRLAEQHPDVLFIPEFQYLGYHTHTSAYRELSAGTTPTPDDIRLAYPDAFSLIKVEDPKLVDAHRDELVKAVGRGDILLFPAWYNPPVNAKVRAIYEAAYGAKK